MNQQKRKFLVLALIGLCLSVHAETLYYTHEGLHLKFAIDTETKEASIGSGLDMNEQNAIALPSLDDSWWNESPQTNYWANLDIPSTIICEGSAYTYNSDVVNIERDTYTVTAVSTYAFYKSTKIQTIKLPNTIKRIGSEAFAWCTNLRSINVPEQVAEIEEGTFYLCRKLESIHLPNGLRKIGNSAFSDCSELKEINIPGTCLSIGSDAFKWCKKLHKLIIEDGSETLSVGCCYGIGIEYESITGDGKDTQAHQRGLFADCKLDTLYLGRNISYPSGYDWYHKTTYRPFPPFERCSEYRTYYYAGYVYFGPALSSLKFGETVTEIADSLFAGDGGYVKENFRLPSKLKKIGKNAFYPSDYYYNFRKLEIPSSVETIGENAFRGIGLEELVLHDGLKTIGDYAFYDNKITSLTIPSTITDFGLQPFDKNQIKTLNLTEGLKTMCSIADAYIVELTIPESIEIINGNFGKSLRFVYCKPTTPPEGGINNNAKVYVPSGTGKTYREYGWSNIIDTADELLTINVKTAGTLYSRVLAQDLNITDVIKLKLKGTLNDDDWITISNMSNLYDLDLSELNLEYLPSGVFHNKTSLNTITLPNTLLSIEDNAFEGCTYLGGTMIIPASCISVGNRAFYGLNLSKLICNGSVNIHEEAFMNCPCLKEVQLAQGTTVGVNAFSSTAIEELYVPSNTKIGDNAFNNITLNKVTFDGGGQEIGDNAFGDRVESYTFYGSVKSIGKFAHLVDNIYVDNINTWCLLPFVHPITTNNLYVNGEKAKDIVIPDEIKSIRKYLFYECKSIETIKLPNEIVEIPERAFKGCSGLANITLPSKLQIIGDSAFAQCVAIQQIVLPMSLTSVGSYAFTGCRSIQGLQLPSSLTSLGDYSLSACSSLEKLDLPSSITSIGQNAFTNCTGLNLIITHWREPITVTNLNGDCLLYVPIGTSQKYVNAGWNFLNMKERGLLTVKVNSGGEVLSDSERVSDGFVEYYFNPYKSFYVTIQPNEGFSVKRVRLNNEIVTSQIDNGKLFIEEPEEDIDMTIVFANNYIQDGDSNGDGLVDDDDAISTANYILKKAPVPFYLYASDVNEDEIINITDILLIISKKNSK